MPRHRNDLIRVCLQNVCILLNTGKTSFKRQGFRWDGVVVCAGVTIFFREKSVSTSVVIIHGIYWPLNPSAHLETFYSFLFASQSFWCFSSTELLKLNSKVEFSLLDIARARGMTQKWLHTPMRQMTGHVSGGWGHRWHWGMPVWLFLHMFRNTHWVYCMHCSLHALQVTQNVWLAMHAVASGHIQECSEPLLILDLVTGKLLSFRAMQIDSKFSVVVSD